MKRSTLIRLIAIVLVISMVAAPVSAAGMNAAANESNGLGGLIEIIIEIIRNIFDGWFGQDDSAETAEPAAPADPGTSTESGAAAPGETAPEAENAVYEQNQSEGGQNADVDLSATGNTPVTMGNVSMGLNALGTVSNAETETVNVNCGFINWVDGGQYYIQNARAAKNVSGASYLKGATNGITGVALENATLWTLHIVDETTFRLSTEIDGTIYYMAIASTGDDGESLTTTPTNLTITFCNDTTDYVDGDGNQLQICGVKYLNQKGSTGIVYRGENSAHDSGSAMWFYLVQNGTTSKVIVAATDDSRDIPVSVLTATCENNQSSDTPDHVLDSDESTLWHTVHQDSDRSTHWIQFELSESYTVDGLRYLPRQSANNGIITDYKILVSNDGENFTEVDSGTWAGDSAWKIAQFEGQNVKYVRLKAENALPTSGNKFASAAEIRLTGVKNEDPEVPEVPEGDSDAHTGLTWQQVKDGTYYADAACTNQVTVNAISEGNNGYIPVTVIASDSATHEFTEYADGTYYYLNGNTYERISSIISSRLGSTSWYVYTDATDANGTYHYVTGETLTIYRASAITGYTLTDANGQTLATLNGTDLTTPVGVTLYTPKVEEPEGPTVVYFPVTMYNYEGRDINASTDALDDDLTVREGFYFSDGGSELGSLVSETMFNTSAFVEGQYYIQNLRAKENGVNGSWLTASTTDSGTPMIFGETKENATLWTLVIEDGAYYLTCQIDGETYYMIVGTDGDTDGYTTTKTPVTLSGYSHNATAVQISQNGYYLSQWNATSQYYGAVNTNNGYGNGMLFYPVDSDEPIAGSVTKTTSGYERWNWWNNDQIYTGLVESQLVDDQIVFTVPEGGVFNDNDTVKEIYEYVGLPFVLKEYTAEDNAGKLGIYYSFDSDENGVYFKGAPQSGTGPEDDQMHKLYFEAGNPQLMFEPVGDKSTNGWFPYNQRHSSTYENDGVTYGRYPEGIDHHFGMRADLPFAMTPNGRIKSTDDESAPITFTFSGDDDVWVFIDGHLVIDLGGIHNRLDVTIDFANNTIIYSEENAQDNDNNTGSYNDPSFKVTQQLFTKDGVTGVIPMSREAFALDPDHEMQVFYLERGKGTSNSRIEFNLPMSDTVIVTKDASKSWSEADEKADLAVNPDDDNAGISELTATEQEIINKLDFGFTLYKKTADDESFAPVANTNFYLIGRGVEGTVIGHTDANGHFYLKNGQSAKFITDLPTEGVTYYVVEDQVPDGFVAPDFKFAGKAAYNYTYTDPTNGADGGTTSGFDASEIPEQIIPMPVKDINGNWTEWKMNKSYEVTVKGAVEKQDSIEFKCINFMNSKLPNPSAFTTEDIIVIDYGLPVQIDPLANDLYRGDSIEIVYWGDENLDYDAVVDALKAGTALEAPKTEYDFGTLTYNYGVSAGDTINRFAFTYTLNKQLTEVEVITYVIKSTGSVVEEATQITKTESVYALGKIYICPATVMYYEENFAGLVTFTDNAKKDNKWGDTIETDGASDYQEPGVVGDPDNSIYGSDVAYVNDSRDSNGTSRYADTTKGALSFTYTFTGTGTTIFGRTSEKTGYIQVKIYDLNGEEEELLGIYYRDTYWKDENLTDLDASGTLYNIPLYTNEDLDYGTYKVVCTIAKAGTPTANYKVDENGDPVLDENGKYIPLGSGNEFYLDGIRIMQPLNADSDAELVEKALDAYETDGESNIDTVTLRYKLISDDIVGDSLWNFAVLTDIDGEVITAEDYISIGPKEEVYLLPGQSVSFSVKYWHPDGYRMHMGMKAPFGDATVQVGQTTYDLNNTVDCYYDITNVQISNETRYEQATDKEGRLLYTDADGNQVYEDEEGYFCYVESGELVPESAELTAVEVPYYVATYTFTATDKIVSLTNIKAVGNYSFILYENIDEEIDGPVGGN